MIFCSRIYLAIYLFLLIINKHTFVRRHNQHGGSLALKVLSNSIDCSERICTNSFIYYYIFACIRLTYVYRSIQYIYLLRKNIKCLHHPYKSFPTIVLRLYLFNTKYSHLIYYICYGIVLIEVSLLNTFIGFTI